MSRPQGLKAAFLVVLGGTTEAVPSPKSFMRPVLVREAVRLAYGADADVVIDELAAGGQSLAVHLHHLDFLDLVF